MTNKSFCFDIQIALRENLLYNASQDVSPVTLWGSTQACN